MHFYEYRSVRYWSKEIDETLTEGRKKIIFLIRDIDRPAMAAAPVESCQYVVLRSPWGRLGSVVDVRNRLRRMRGRFDHWIQIKTGPQQSADLYHRNLLPPSESGPSAPVPSIVNEN